MAWRVGDTGRPEGLAHWLVAGILLAPLAVTAAPDFTRLAGSLEPIALAHAADSLGDATILRTLEQPPTREALLVAIRSAPFASAPESLVPALVTHACGRDHAAAPDAALALLSLTEILSADRLAVREASLAAIGAAKSALESGCEHAPRPDVELALKLLAQHLSAL